MAETAGAQKGMFGNELLPGFNATLFGGARIEHSKDAGGNEYVSLVFGHWLQQALATLSDPTADETTVRIPSTTHGGVPTVDLVGTVLADGIRYWSEDGITATSVKRDEKSVRDAFWKIAKDIMSGKIRNGKVS